MKRIIFLLLVIVLLITSCSKANTQDIDVINLSDPDQNFSDIKTSEQTENPEEEQLAEEIVEEVVESEENENALSEQATKEELVKIIGVSESGDKCILNIKGTPVVIREGRSETVNGITVYVKEVVAVHSQTGTQDVCELLIS